MRREEVREIIDKRVSNKYTVSLPYLFEEKRLNEDGTVNIRYIKDSNIARTYVELDKLLKEILEYFGLYYFDDVLMTREQAEKLLEAKEKIFRGTK